MLMVLNRTYTLRSTLGFTLHFKANQPTWVPERLYREAAGLGALPVEGEIPTEVLAEPSTLTEQEKLLSAPAPEGPARETAILEAIQNLVARNSSSDFTASGYPDANALSKLVGFKIYADERDVMWRKMQEAA